MYQQYKTEASMTKHNILFIGLDNVTDTSLNGNKPKTSTMYAYLISNKTS